MAVLHPIRVFSMTGQVVPFPPLIAFLYLSLEGPKLCIADARELFCSDGRASIGAGFRGALSRRVAMSESDQFRQYAEEAMRWVAQSKTEEEKQLLIELLCTWTAAAVAAEAIAIPIAKPPEHAGR